MIDESPVCATAPTVARVGTARDLARLHVRLDDPFVRDHRCAWCLKRWPCPDVVWCGRVLDRAVREGVGQG